MIYLLDTNIFVEHLRRRAKAALTQRLRHLNPVDVVSCSIVRAELMAGANHGKAPLDELARVRNLLSQFKSLPFDDSAADEYGKLRADLESRGNSIGSNDLMIASIALSQNLVVVTHNCSEFLRVPNLRIEDWQST